jgi:hypothetical protein
MADTNFSFTYTSSIFSMTGELTATNEGSGTFLATSGTGTYSDPLGNNVTLTLIPIASASTITFAGGDDIFPLDDLIYPGGNSVDGSQVLNGLAFSFTGAQGSSGVAITDNAYNPPSFTDVGGPNGTKGQYTTLYSGGVFAVTNIPDGGMTIMLLGGALVGLATLRRKFRE